MRLACIALAICAASGCAGGAPETGSIGARLGRDNDTQAVYVREVPEGLPAAEAGLEPEDEIVMIDGMYVRTMSNQDLESKLRGPIGSTVALTLSRGARVVHVELKRSALRSQAPLLKQKEPSRDE